MRDCDEILDLRLGEELAANKLAHHVEPLDILADALVIIELEEGHRNLAELLVDEIYVVTRELVVKGTAELDQSILRGRPGPRRGRVIASGA